MAENEEVSGEHEVEDGRDAPADNAQIAAGTGQARRSLIAVLAFAATSRHLCSVPVLCTPGHLASPSHPAGPIASGKSQGRNSRRSTSSARSASSSRASSACSGTCRLAAKPRRGQAKLGHPGCLLVQTGTGGSLMAVSRDEAGKPVMLPIETGRLLRDWEAAWGLEGLAYEVSIDIRPSLRRSLARCEPARRVIFLSPRLLAGERRSAFAGISDEALLLARAPGPGGSTPAAAPGLPGRAARSAGAAAAGGRPPAARGLRRLAPRASRPQGPHAGEGDRSAEKHRPPKAPICSLTAWQIYSTI